MPRSFCLSRGFQNLVVVGLLIWPLADNPTRANERQLPGSAWSQFRFPASFGALEQDDFIVEGSVEQVAWSVPVADDVVVQAFGRIDYKVDTEELDFNNKFRPAAGLKLSLTPLSGAVIELGARYEWERRFRSDRTFEGITGFLNWHGWWGVAESGRFPSSISTYGQFRYPSAHVAEEKKNAIVEGALRTETEWARWGDMRVLSRLEIEYAADTEEYDYNNKIIPSLGPVMKFNTGAGDFEIGVRYAYDYRPISGSTQDGFVGFIGWSARWNL